MSAEAYVAIVGLAVSVLLSALTAWRDKMKHGQYDFHDLG